jgi:hypothetical protein
MAGQRQERRQVSIASGKTSGALSLISVVFLEHVQKKLLDFFDSDVLQLFDFERVLIDQMVPFDRDAP